MSLIAALLVIVLPVFLVVGTGYALVRVKFFPDSGVDALVRFTTGLAVPCLLFMAMYELDLGTAMRASHLIAFYTASLTCFAVALLASGSPAGAQPAPLGNDRVAAEALFDEGRNLVAAGKIAEACPKFADSQRLDPSPSTLLNLASCWEKLGRTARRSEFHLDDDLSGRQPGPGHVDPHVSFSGGGRRRNHQSDDNDQSLESQHGNHHNPTTGDTRKIDHCFSIAVQICK